MTRTLISNTDSTKTIKFLYSYGGKIIPRPTDGKLRYVGGMTRVLAIDRSITFAELMVKFRDLCGLSMSLKCKLPTEDLDVLVSITCDEDLAGVSERRLTCTPRPLPLRVLAAIYSHPHRRRTQSPDSVPHRHGGRRSPVQAGGRNSSPSSEFSGKIRW
ncbi:octicosapeptide/Phox/Bem1p family protein [Actinidia rufa]|uniref:Octicosapeptide/Phox/Bem1p family protein n=1 Tax=Actinidia rufa TaxID=165716 RepID=A0A7J0GMG6_9ERIC|nr:octicosapeptide/Phox/Bem1p family protein [Actinidia rufa]